jgi:hypothetical protein
MKGMSTPADFAAAQIAATYLLNCLLELQARFRAVPRDLPEHERAGLLFAALLWFQAELDGKKDQNLASIESVLEKLARMKREAGRSPVRVREDGLTFATASRAIWEITREVDLKLQSENVDECLQAVRAVLSDRARPDDIEWSVESAVLYHASAASRTWDGERWPFDNPALRVLISGPLWPKFEDTKGYFRRQSVNRIEAIIALDFRLLLAELELEFAGTTGQPPGDELSEDRTPDWNELITSPPLPATKIAEMMGQPVRLVERILRHQRKVQPFCFALDDSPQKGEARYLHKMPNVIPALKAWLEKRHKKRSNPSD